MNRTESLPMVALRGMTILPEMVAHFDISRERSIEAVQEAMASDQKIFLLTQKDVEVENPGEADLYRVGTVATDHQTAKADSAGACICRRAGGFKYNRICRSVSSGKYYDPGRE